MKIKLGTLREFIRDVLSPEKSNREQIKSVPDLELDPHLEDDMDVFDLGPVPPDTAESDAYHLGTDPYNTDWSVLPTQKGGWRR